jgi:hypothetical protein
MEGLNDVLIRSLKGQVHVRHGSIGLVDKQLIGVEEPITFYKAVLQADRTEYRAIKARACRDIGYPQMHVINESAAVNLHCITPRDALTRIALRR